MFSRERKPLDLLPLPPQKRNGGFTTNEEKKKIVRKKYKAPLPPSQLKLKKLEIATEEGDCDEYNNSASAAPSLAANKRANYSAPAAILSDNPQAEKDYDPLADRRPRTIADRENEYQMKRKNRIISPERVNPFAESEVVLGPIFVSDLAMEDVHLNASGSSWSGFGYVELSQTIIDSNHDVWMTDDDEESEIEFPRSGNVKDPIKEFKKIQKLRKTTVNSNVAVKRRILED
uniref:Uncharacterized protein n=1 Tax=Strigamia maritima TaxID=126957 RepID=T1IVQ0_STRMM